MSTSPEGGQDPLENLFNAPVFNDAEVAEKVFWPMVDHLSRRNWRTEAHVSNSIDFNVTEVTDGISYAVRLMVDREYIEEGHPEHGSSIGMLSISEPIEGEAKSKITGLFKQELLGLSGEEDEVPEFDENKELVPLTRSMYTFYYSNKGVTESNAHHDTCVGILSKDLSLYLVDEDVSDYVYPLEGTEMNEAMTLPSEIVENDDETDPSLKEMHAKFYEHDIKKILIGAQVLRVYDEIKQGASDMGVDL